jgi:signal transduction histidine kinase
MEIEQLGRELPGSRKAIEQYRRLQLHAQEISTDIHRLSYRLHPSKLDHLGLGSAVKSLCRELSENGTLDVAFQERGLPRDLPQDITLCLFRVAQESLRNCAKHSGSQTAQVLLSRINNAIRLTVSDQGRGFDTNSDLMKRGLGFISMQERLKIVGGEIKIFSTAFRGTRIEVCVPLKKQIGSRQDPNHVASYLESETTSRLRPISSNSPLIELEEI